MPLMTVHAREEQVQCLAYPSQLGIGDRHRLDGEGPVRAGVLTNEPV
jgi:hypothetical protein